MSSEQIAAYAGLRQSLLRLVKAAQQAQTHIIEGYHLVPVALTEGLEDPNTPPDDSMGVASLERSEGSYRFGCDGVLGPWIHCVETGKVWRPSWGVLFDMAQDAGITEGDW